MLQISAWKFTLCTDPFQVRIWFNISIVFTLVTVTLLLQASDGERGSIIMSMVSSTLVMGPLGVPRRSKLFILWLGISTVIAQFYSGSISSALTKPPEEDVIKTWSELHNQNYTLHLFYSKYYLKAIVNAMPPGRNKFFETIGELLKNFTLSKFNDDSHKKVFSVIAFSKLITGSVR